MYIYLGMVPEGTAYAYFPTYSDGVTFETHLEKTECSILSLPNIVST